jgi:hypothetical protein
MILQLLIAWFSFLFSLWGLTCVLIGIVLFLGLPLISMVSRFKAFSRFFLRLAALPLRRAAFVVSEHNDIYFRQMQFDALGVERIKIDGETKLFGDPDSSLHHWLGMNFALADEEHGVLGDPRHAALGKRKKELEDRGEGEYFPTTDEHKAFGGVEVWKPGVFEFPDGVTELVDLSHMQELIDGGERSEYAERVEQLYQHSRAPLQNGSSGIQYLMPIIAFAITFGGIWLLSSQIGGPDSTVSYFLAPAVSALAGLPFIGSADDGDDDTDPLDEPGAGNSGGDDDDDGPSRFDEFMETMHEIDWGLVGGIFALTATPLVFVSLLYVFLGVVYAFSITMSLLLGMAMLPILTLLSQPSAIIGGAFSKLYFRLGFMGYRRPVMEWTPAKYRIREYDRLESTDDVTWYDGFGTILGFSFDPSPSSWDAEVIPQSEIESQQPVTDGGTVANSNLPADVVPSTQMRRDDYGAYLPKRVRDDKYYLHTGIAMNRFSNSAVGEKSLRKLLEAKETHGTSNEGLDDSTVFKATLITGLLGALGGIAIFLLPAFL